MSEVKAIAKINREIKNIVSVAENLSLTAADAMLAARQAGGNVEGFTMVVRELRMFSDQITAAMQGLSELIHWQLEINATKRHQVRRLDVLVKAGEGGGLAQARIAPACLRNQADIDEIERLIVSQVRDLQMTMRRTGKQCATGLTIARSASLEAAYGSAMTPLLRQIAQDVEAVVGTITVRVNKLEAQLAEIGL